MSFIKTHIDQAIYSITLTRADKFNSFNTEMAQEMHRALDEAANNKDIRAIYLTGEGKAFCAGQDLSEAVDPNGPGTSTSLSTRIKKIVGENYNPVIKKIRTIEKPVVCAVNGVAAGAGANIALACDIVIAGASASFIQAFSKIGLVPDSGGTFILPRLIGWQRASALCMLGDKVSAADALQMGMIYKVVDDDKLPQEAKAIAMTLSQMPTKGIGLTKRLLNESFHNSLDKQLDLERDIQAEAAATHDYKEGVKAFLEKRKPNFKGE